MEDDFGLNDPYDVLTADQIKVEAAAHEAKLMVNMKATQHSKMVAERIELTSKALSVLNQLGHKNIVDIVVSDLQKITTAWQYTGDATAFIEAMQLNPAFGEPFDETITIKQFIQAGLL
jgi:hypothetical protein